LVGAGYAWVATSTRPFTVPAEVVTTIPLALLLLVGVLQPRLKTPLLRRAGPRGLDSDRRRSDKKARFTLGLWIWGALIALISLWEVGNLFAGMQVVGGRRYDHPTLSFFLDSITQHHVTNAGLFLVWLIFGFYLLRR
jgi:hypothetical protein